MPKPRDGYLVKDVLGSKMCLDLSDIGISRDLALGSIREENNIETVRKEVKEGNIVIDIGANIGYFALLEAKLVGDNGKIYAIEPVPSNIELLVKNIKLNNYSNIEVFQLAIGDTNGLHSMHISSKSNLGTLKDVAGTNKEKFAIGEIEVETMTLDDFLRDKPYPSVIRMDVEGYEYEIIKGMKNTLRRKTPLVIFIEFHFHLLRKQESIDIFKTLKSCGFRIADVSAPLTMPGRYRHKSLSKIMRFLELEIEKEFNLKPRGRHLSLDFDEILSNPLILSGKWGGFHICFKRE